MTVPALPVRDVGVAAQYYVAHFGFQALHQDAGFAVLVRDEARIHLWQAGDEGWRGLSLEELRDSPVRTGAESFLAGTASCRIAVDGIESVADLYAELAAAEVLHPGDQGAPRDADFGTNEFATVDLDGNLLEFFCWRV